MPAISTGATGLARVVFTVEFGKVLSRSLDQSLHNDLISIVPSSDHLLGEYIFRPGFLFFLIQYQYIR